MKIQISFGLTSSEKIMLHELIERFSDTQPTQAKCFRAFIRSTYLHHFGQSKFNQLTEKMTPSELDF